MPSADILGSVMGLYDGLLEMSFCSSASTADKAATCNLPSSASRSANALTLWNDDDDDGHVELHRAVAAVAGRPGGCGEEGSVKRSRVACMQHIARGQSVCAPDGLDGFGDLSGRRRRAVREADDGADVDGRPIEDGLGELDIAGAHAHGGDLQARHPRGNGTVAPELEDEPQASLAPPTTDARSPCARRGSRP